MKKDYLALFPAEALSCVYFFADFKRFQNKESFPKIFRFVFEIKLLFSFLVQFSGFLT